MSTISTVAVDFIANTAKYVEGLAKVQTATKKWSNDTQKQTKNATDAFDGASKALDRFSKQIIGAVAIQRLASSISNAVVELSNLADEAAKIGAGVEQFQLLKYAADKSNISIESVKKGYIELQKSLSDVTNNNKEVIKAFDDLGISTSYLASLKPDERFYTVADALSKLADVNERARIGTILLGKSFNELNPLIENGAAGIEKFRRGAKESGAVLSATDVTKIDALSKKFDEIAIVLKGKIYSAIIELLPQINAFADAALKVAKNIDTIGKYALIAFSPLIVVGVINQITKLIILLKELQEILAVNAFFEFTSGASALAQALGPILTPAIEGLTKALVALRVVLLGVVTLLPKLAIALSGLAVGYLGGLELGKKANEIAAALTSGDTSAEYKRRAQAYKDASLIIQEAIGIGNGPEVVAQVEAFTDAERAALPAAQALAKAENAKNLERDRSLRLLKEMTALTIKEGEAFAKAMTDYGKSITESVATPSEKAAEELDKLNEAFLFGYITIDTYNRAISKLQRDAAQSTLDYIKSPAEAVKTQILEFGRLYAEGVITFEQADAAIKKATFEAGKSVRDFIRTPIEEAKQKILDFAVSYQEGFITIEEATAATEKVIKEMGQGIVNYLATPADEIKKRIGDIVELYQAGFISLEQSTAALAKANVELWEATNPEIMKAFEFMSSFADQFSRAIVEGQNFGDALSSVFKNILRDIAALILKTTILQGIMASIGLVNVNAAAAFGKMTGIIPRAKGGPVMAGNTYRVGEAGPETFVPAINGYILPNDMKSGEQVNVTQNIYVQTGVAQTVRAEMIGLLPRFKQEALAGVLDAKQRGGSYSKGLAA